MLRGMRAYDPLQWKRMVGAFAPLIYRWCIRAGARPDDAPDIVQEVFRVVAARIDDFNKTSDGSFHGWLLMITRNKLGDTFRRSKSEPTAIGGSDFLNRVHLIPDERSDPLVSANDGLADIYQGILALIGEEFSEKTWQAFWLTAVEGRYPADVAQELGMSVNSVYLAKGRVLRRLREEIEPPPGRGAKP
ncbi:MAG: sigma-70 family RNA polymerase sigma factor [Planctomycetes bacterium]|nr:sigma-70 family RNA polymerase sigma factor [Planctomycetota bacterium]